MSPVTRASSTSASRASRASARGGSRRSSPSRAGAPCARSGRGGRGRPKVVPVALVLLAFGPALVVLGVSGAMVGGRVDELPEILLPYAGYYGVIGVVGPGVRGDDHAGAPVPGPPRPRARPVPGDRRERRSSTSLGKVLAAVVPLLCLTFVPQFYALRRQRDLRRGRVRLPARQRRHAVPRSSSPACCWAVYFALLAPGDLVAHRSAPLRCWRLPRPDAGSPPAIAGSLASPLRGDPRSSSSWRSAWSTPIGARASTLSGELDERRGGVDVALRQLALCRRGSSRASSCGGATGGPRDDHRAARRPRGGLEVVRHHGRPERGLVLRSGPGVTGLLGKNGAGKSTALKLLSSASRRPTAAPCECLASTRAATTARAPAAGRPPWTATASGPSCRRCAS